MTSMDRFSGPRPQGLGRPGAAARPLRSSARALLAAAAGALFFAACSGNSNADAGGPIVDPGSGNFSVVGTSVVDGSEWKLNRAMNIEFNQDVDFATVSLSTIQIVDNQGVPAIGTFTAFSSRIVRFQPRCPTNDTNSNGGLLQGRTYRLTVPGENSPGLGQGVTVENTAGQRLRTGLNVSFSTPVSNDPLVLFVDVVSGPPQVRVRGLNGEPTDSLSGSFVEFGNDPDNVEFFEFNGTLIPPQGAIASLVPLNLYSRVSDQFSIVLRFNQPIFAASTNVNNSLIGLEYENPIGSNTWLRVPSTVALINNCTTTGAAVRVSPSGIVPQGANMRVVLREGFQDLTGDRVQSTQTAFARFASEVANPGALDPGAGSDEILELFTIGGNLPGSLEDTTIASGQPRANWSGDLSPGALSASFAFSGTGGPNGDFDVRVRAGQTVFINTDADSILGGPDGNPTTEVPIISGVLDVNDFIVDSGGRVVFLGSNTATILATGSVMIAGEVNLNGGDNAGDGTLNTTNQPEEGAAGQAGGGSGGQGSFLTAQSTPVGGRGNGAFDVPGLGGLGGETGYSSPSGTNGKERRRGAGGGGGRLGQDVRFDFDDGLGGLGFFRCQALIGMDAEPGFSGSLDGMGAVSQATFAMGGAMSPFPFLDASDNNDFFGTLLTSNGSQILGELPSVWAGAGGGAGGDAVSSSTFPLTPFTITGDEKGSGGGGGAGGLLILAIGNIEITGDGELTADGGTGGAGENVIFFDRIGGGSGGGSGGHIVMSSASSIIISSESTNIATGLFYQDDPTRPVHEKRPLRALGGQGGAGRESFCGANENGETQWRSDAIPPEAFESNTLIPPQGLPSFNNCNRVAANQMEPAEGVVLGGGGDGGPGIIQLHVSDPATQLLFPNRIGEVYGVNLDPTLSMAPPPFGWTRPSDPADVMIPFFSARSEAYSTWLPLGLARVNPDGTTNQVEFLFAGTDTVDGSVNRAGTLTEELLPILAFSPLSAGGALPSVDGASATFTISGAGVDDLYKLNGSLMRQFAVRLRDAGNPASESEFIVQSGTYDPTGMGVDEFALVVDPRGATLQDRLLSITSPEVEVVPFFFRFLTAGVNDAYPGNTEVLISFDATVENPLTGLPSADPAAAFSNGDVTAFTPDISLLNADVWDFVRFKVEFNLDEAMTGVDLQAPRPGMNYLRIPYRF